MAKESPADFQRKLRKECFYDNDTFKSLLSRLKYGKRCKEKKYVKILNNHSAKSISRFDENGDVLEIVGRFSRRNAFIGFVNLIVNQ